MFATRSLQDLARPAIFESVFGDFVSIEVTSERWPLSTLHLLSHTLHDGGSQAAQAVSGSSFEGSSELQLGAETK